MLFADWLPIIRHCFLILPRTTSIRMVLPRLGWDLSYQSSIKKMFHRHTPSSFQQGKFLKWIFSSNQTISGILLTKNQNISRKCMGKSQYQNISMAAIQWRNTVLRTKSSLIFCNLLSLPFFQWLLFSNQNHGSVILWYI